MNIEEILHNELTEDQYNTVAEFNLQMQQNSD